MRGPLSQQATATASPIFPRYTHCRPGIPLRARSLPPLSPLLATWQGVQASQNPMTGLVFLRKPNRREPMTHTDIRATDNRGIEQAIALGQLVPSKANVRRVNSMVGIDELADSIEAHGLIQNIAVRKAEKGTKFEVVAGARRLAALRLLFKEGRTVQGEPVTKGFLVRSITVPDDQLDTEISLAENVQREAMHVVDEVLAYKALIDEGKAVEDVAARFGQSIVTVRKRLKLASLSPRILDVLREDGMSLEQAKAMAVSDDHAAQETAWFERQDWNRSAGNLRAALTQEHVRATDRLAVFVGMEAYEAAGGGVMRDLFADEGGVFLTDRPLLVELARERLLAPVDELRLRGWKWVDVSVEPFSPYSSGYSRIQPVERALTEAEDAELQALSEAFDLLAERTEGYAEGDPANEEDAARQRDLDSRIRAIKQAALAYDPQEMGQAGCMVSVAHDGQMQLTQGLVTAEDRKTLDALRRGETDNGDAASADGNATTKANAYSAALVEELTAIRTAALRVELAHRPEIAMAALLYPLVSGVFYSGIRFDRPEAAVEVSGQRRDLAPSIKEPEACRALTEWQNMLESWGDRIPGSPDDLWDWLLAQPADTLSELLALVTAANLNAVKGAHDSNGKRVAQADRVAEAVALDMRTWWAPQAPFLSRLSKSGITEVVRGAGGSETVLNAVLRSPKGEAVTLAEQALQGKHWLPVLLRGPGCGDVPAEAETAIAAE